MSRPSDRRGFLRALAAAPLLAPAAVTAAASPSPDEDLLAMGSELEALWEAERSIPDGEYDGHPVVKASSELVDRICGAESRSLEGLRVKTRALLWCYACDRDELLAVLAEEDPRTKDWQLMIAIIRDLVGIETSPACR